jgi:hypothetical protein
MICFGVALSFIPRSAAFSSHGIMRVGQVTGMQGASHSMQARLSLSSPILSSGRYSLSRSMLPLSKTLESRRFASSEANRDLGSSTFCKLAELAGGDGSGGSIRRRSGGGDNNGDEGGGDKQEEGEIAALLKQYGLAASQLPKGAELLDAKKLARFLASYSNRFNKWLIDVWPGLFQLFPACDRNYAQMMTSCDQIDGIRLSRKRAINLKVHAQMQVTCSLHATLGI